MLYLNKYKNFIIESALTDTKWVKEEDDGIIEITLKDVIYYLDNKDIVELDPKELKHLLIDVERDPKRVDNADLSYPVILAEKDGELIEILDGNHRIVKAIRDDVKIKARILNLDKAPEKFKKVFLQ